MPGSRGMDFKEKNRIISRFFEDNNEFTHICNPFVLLEHFKNVCGCFFFWLLDGEQIHESQENTNTQFNVNKEWLKFRNMAISV